MNVRRHDGRETWSRLLEWDKGQSPSERLAATLLTSEGFTGIDPSHPLGGKDGGKDALLNKDELNLALAVFFPRGQQSFKEIQKKFQCDFRGVATHRATGFVFFTNQELRMGERSELIRSANNIPVEIYHLERISTLLNTPQNYGVRLEFLQIAMTNEEIVALYAQRDKDHLKQLLKVSEALEEATRKIISHTTGGDSFCCFHVGKSEDSNQTKWTIVHYGRYPVYAVSARIVDLDTFEEETKTNRFSEHSIVSIGDMSTNSARTMFQADLGIGNTKRFNIFFNARNGFYTQILRFIRVDGSWKSATKIILQNGPLDEPAYVEIDDEFPGASDGVPIWDP